MRWLDARQTLWSGFTSFFKVVNWIGYVSLSGMILLTTANVFGRYIFKRPLLGEVDMVELGMAVFGGVAMFLAAIQRHHVSVDVLLVHFSRRTRSLLERIASLVGFVTWALLASLAFLDGLDKLQNGSKSATLFLPQGPFEMILSVMIFLFGLTLLKQAFSPEGSGEKEEGGPPP
jgi:TRAP-type C4-dicarboxylate transport system permease small subunit